MHENVPRKGIEEFGSDPVQAFPGHRQMKPEQLEIARLEREVAESFFSSLKTERTARKNS